MRMAQPNSNHPGLMGDLTPAWNITRTSSSQWSNCKSIEQLSQIIPKLTVSQLVMSNGNPQKKVRTKNGRIFSNSISLPFLQRHRYSAMAPFCLQAATCIQRHIRSALNTQLPVPILGGVAMAKGTIGYHRYHRSHKIDVKKQ